MNGNDPAVSTRLPRLIRNEAEYDAAIAAINALLCVTELSSEQSDRLDGLTDIVETYEKVHHAIDTSDVTGADMVQHLAEEHGLTEAELAQILRLDTAATADLVAGRKPITADQARVLGKRFAVLPGLFIA